jgi:DNA-binding response OmpR family regulator
MPGLSGDTLTILVVEDDASVGELLREILNDVPGWGATVVHDAAAARAVFHYVQVEIMVLDLNLPGISGLELLELLRRDAEWRDPPVILISAAPGQPGVQEALERRMALRIIAKPFDVDQLVEAVRVAAAEYLDSGSS